MAKTKTSKLVKYHMKTYIDEETGERVPGAASIIEERDFNFHKIWMRDFISKMELVGNQKTKIAYWIINNLNKDNQLIYTYRQISIHTDTSLETVRSTMSILIKEEFLRKLNNGCYIVNPDIIFKGTKAARAGVFNIYQSVDRQEPELDEQIADIQKSIENLTKRLEHLINKKAQKEINITPKTAELPAPEERK